MNIQGSYKNLSCFVDPTATVSKDVVFNVNGDGHSINIGANVFLSRFYINIKGCGNTLNIGKNCHLRGEAHIRQCGSSIEIGRNTTFVSARLFAMEGKKIFFGEDCMVSSDVILRTSDEHSVLDLTSSERINLAADITIGDHVWIGEGVTVGKGCDIAEGSVVGAKAMVLKSLKTPNSLYVGTPAVFIKSNICWDRKLL